MRKLVNSNSQSINFSLTNTLQQIIKNDGNNQSAKQNSLLVASL